MHVKRTAAIVLGGAALAAWLSAAIAPAGRTIAIPPVRESAADARSANLADEIARLHDRLRPDAVPRQPGRNLFAFHAPPAAPAPPVHAALTEIAAHDFVRR